MFRQNLLFHCDFVGNKLHSAVPFPNKSQPFGAFQVRMMTSWNQFWKDQERTTVQTRWDWLGISQSVVLLVQVSQLTWNPEIPRRFLHRKHGTKSASDDKRAQWQTHLGIVRRFCCCPRGLLKINHQFQKTCKSSHKHLGWIIKWKKWKPFRCPPFVIYLIPPIELHCFQPRYNKTWKWQSAANVPWKFRSTGKLEPQCARLVGLGWLYAKWAKGCFIQRYCIRHTVPV